MGGGGGPFFFFLLALRGVVGYCILINKQASWATKMRFDPVTSFALNMLLEGLNPTELSAGPSLQTHDVQKRIV